MMNRRGFLNKFLKGAAATAVVAPTLLLKPRPEETLHTEEELLEEATRYVHKGPYHDGDIMDYIHHIDPIDTPLFQRASTEAEAHEWLTDELSPPGAINGYAIDRAMGEDVEKRRADLADWIDQPSFSRPAIEAACGKNPSFWPEGSRERITALGAEALKRSAAATDFYGAGYVDWKNGNWMNEITKKCGSSLASSSSS